MRTKVGIAVGVLLWLLWNPGYAADESSGLPKGLRLSLREGTQLDKANGQRIVSILQNLGKTLILERTRAQKDEEVYQRAASAVVFVTDTKERLGSGVVIDDKGQTKIITSWHVVANRPRVFVVFKPKDNTELKEELAFVATVEKVDEVADLALLRIITPRKSFRFLQLGNAQALVVGQDVHAIGHPKGLTWTYTKGIISQIRDDYEWPGIEGRVHRAKVIQTQTPINPGNSGGPLLDDKGSLIGLNSFGSPQAQGLNFAVAVDVIEEFLQRPINRLAPASEQSGTNVESEPLCPDAYDTRRQGWNDIVGCYRSTIAPPPDFWLVYRVPKQPAAYMALSMLGKGIDTVITSPEQKWEELIHFIDVDCNGTIDLVGYQGKGSDWITGFRLPPKPMRMLTLAKELDRAIKLRKIPYRNLKLCQ